MKSKYIYSPEQIVERFKYVIANNVKHKYKKHCEEISLFWKSMVTGIGQDCFIISYRLSESDNQKKQRIRLHIPESVGVVNQMITTGKQINRTDNISEEWIGKDEDIAQVKERLMCYDGEDTLETYWDEKNIQLNTWDPNAFNLNDAFEFDEANEKPFVFPTVIYSAAPQKIKQENKDMKEETLLQQSHPHWRDYEYYNKILQYLIYDDTESLVTTVDGQVAVTDTQVYWCISKGQACKLTMVPKGYDYRTHIEESDGDAQMIDLKETEKIMAKVPKRADIELDITSSGTHYILEVFDTKTNFVPARRVGYFKDPLTNGDVFESWLYGSKYSLIDLARKKAELDVSIATKGYVKTYQYVPTCSHIDKEDPNDCCLDGTMSKSLSACPKCSGTGKKKIKHSSPQDLITFDLTYREPAEEEDLIDLSKLIHNVAIPKEALEMTKQLVEECKVNCSKNVFNTNIFNRSEVVSMTATEARAMNAPINNVLWEFATAKANNIKFSIHSIADFMDFHDIVKYLRKYSSDFGLETVTEILTMIKCAKDAGSHSEVVKALTMKLLSKLNRDNPERLNKIAVQECYRPFAGLSDSERVSKTSSLPELDSKKILCLYFDDIFRYIDHNMEGFYSITNKDKREDQLEEVIEMYRARYIASKPAVIGDGFDAIDDESIVIEGNAEPSVGGSREGNALAQSVGGSGIVSGVKRDIAEGVSTREGGINQVMIQLGYDRATAELLITEPPTAVPNQDLV